MQLYKLTKPTKPTGIKMTHQDVVAICDCIEWSTFWIALAWFMK